MAIPDGGLADPRGLWVAAFLGTLFGFDPFFAGFVYAGIHYLSIWPSNFVVTMPILMNGEFIMTMSWLYGWGLFSGLAWIVLVRPGRMFPTHIFDDSGSGRRYRFGIFALAISLIILARQITILAGFYRAHVDWGDSPVSDDAQLVIDWIILVVFAVLAVSTAWHTAVNLSGSPLSVVFYGRKTTDGDGPFILASFFALMFLLAPQAIFDFLGAPPPAGDFILWQAGLITFGIEAVLWIIIFFVFRDNFDMDNTHFGDSRGITWRDFCISTGSIHIGTGIIYILLVSPLNGNPPVITLFEEMNWLFAGFFVLVAIIGFILRYAEVAGKRKGGYTGIDRRVSRSSEMKEKRRRG